MRTFTRMFLWLVAALFCGSSTVVFSYIALFIGVNIFPFGIESQTAIKFWHGSLAFFAILSCVFLTYLARKMLRGDL